MTVAIFLGLMVAPVMAKTNPAILPNEMIHSEPYDGSYEVRFFETIPEPEKVYRVIYSTLQLEPSESNTDIYNAVCMVALEEMLDESADDYENVVKFITPFQSVIFGPNSEFPRDAVEFENAFNCMEYDDMRVR